MNVPPSSVVSVNSGTAVPGCDDAHRRRPERLQELAVALEVGALKVVEEAAAAADEHQEAAPGVVVAAVLAQVLGEAVDPLGQLGDLDLDVPGVVLVRAVLRGELALSFTCEGHRGRER